MPTTNDPEVFEQRWKDHINEVELLKQSLPAEKWDELDELRKDLNNLVEEAVFEVEDDE